MHGIGSVVIGISKGNIYGSTKTIIDNIIVYVIKMLLFLSIGNGFY